MNPFIGKTYAESLALVADKYASREALVFGDQRFTFTEVKAIVDRTAARLATLGLEPGSTIAIWLPNRPEFIWYWLALAQMGLIAVVLNTRLQRDEFVYQLDQSDCVAVIVPGPDGFRDFLGELAEVCLGLKDRTPGVALSATLPKIQHVICCDRLTEAWPRVLDWSSPVPADLPPAPIARDPERAALIAYSSGTTALPKGTMLNHCAWRKTWDGGERLGAHQDDRLYLCVPLFGVLAMLNGVLTFWTRGAAIVLAERFVARVCRDTVKEMDCTAIHLLPAMVADLLGLSDFSPDDFSNVRTGIALTQDPDLIDQVATKLGVRGVVTSYGMTETTGVVTRTWWSDPLKLRKASQGTPLPGVTVRIVDPETGSDAQAGAAGEIWIRGYCVMAGYYKKPEETRAALTDDGWLRTGDAGRLLPDGSVIFQGRLKDGYKHKGFNVSTIEVEKALASHPAVVDAQVVGLPDSRNGEIGIAFVIARNKIPAQDLIDYLRPRLASFKLPERVFFVEEFRVTAGTGKVQKFHLKQLAQELLKEHRENIR